MKKLLAVATAGFIVAAIGAGAAWAQVPPLSVYGRLPNVEQIEISPDGTKLAIAVTDGESRMLLIREAAEGGKLLSAMNFATTKLRGVQWAGMDHVLVTTSSTAEVHGLSGPKREYLMAFDYNLVTKKQRLLMANEEEAMNVVLEAPDVRFIDGVPYAFVEGVHFLDNRGVNTLYKINLATGATRRLDSGVNEDTDDWLVSPDGQPLAQSRYDQKKGDWTLKIKGERGWITAEQVISKMGSHGVAGIGRDGHSALAWMDDEDDEDKTVLNEYALDGSHVVIPDSARFDGLIHAPDGSSLVGAFSLVGDDRRYIFFDAKLQTSWNAVTKAFPGEQVTLVSWSNDKRQLVVQVDSPTQGPAYALVNLNTKSASFLSEVYKDLTPEGVSKVEPIKYKAADGLEITGYLTLPNGKAPKNLPLVVLPHGGPKARDTLEFDWWSQALASRGYAVLRPNFRGSDGFGWPFVKAGFGEWGKAMQTDLSDGVRYLAKQGTIDPKRVCIVGASYGGYAALAGATLDRGVYRCAASIAGPADLKRFLVDKNRLYESNDNSTQRFWLRYMGADGLKDPDLAAISPVQQAGKAEIPVLLIHGKDDTVVPYVQSTLMADALKKAGKPVELITLPSEDHWLSRGATRLQMLTAVVGFLEKNNPPN
ncbi:alpha/beta hydrolase family protein [Caulobacter soli]|uniref:alpha/beta hydrolase family protein n=1 Tax=Caulobacter soli TaxID=2708539 RepID=UPI0013ECA102|nr:S9 family peptidase [Caulobacter soli]